MTRAVALNLPKQSDETFAMPSFDLFSIGHSNIPIARFMAMLQASGVNAIADVRSTPASRRFPWFSAKALAAQLALEDISYEPYGDALGGRPGKPELYDKGIADYEAMARRPEFHAGIEKLLSHAAQCRLCLMCAEREPLDCHRSLLIARSLAERGLIIGHILHDGTVEPHATTEQRLLTLTATTDDLFVTGQNERLAAAYRRRARAVAYRVPVSTGANAAAGRR